jgi:hypothetical protein
MAMKPMHGVEKIMGRTVCAMESGPLDDDLGTIQLRITFDDGAVFCYQVQTKPDAEVDGKKLDLSALTLWGVREANA